MPINNTPASRDVIGSPANRRSQRGDVCLQFSCSYKHAYLPAGVSARGFLCMRILSSSHRSFLFLCVHGVGVAFFSVAGGKGATCVGRRCMQADESEVAARLASDLFTHGDGLGDGGGGFPRGHVEGAWDQ